MYPSKEEFLKMPVEEKRNFYKCRGNYVGLGDIPTWSTLAEEGKFDKTSKRRYQPSPSLNEKVSVWQGDITCLEVDAVVNAANESLLGGGGVDGAIQSAAGHQLVEETGKLGGCHCGHAKITGGYKLPASYVIHTVGPKGKHEAQLRSCYFRCLEVMRANGLKTLAFSSISTGLYGYPSEEAAEVALEAVRGFLDLHGNEIQRIIFCVFSQED
ncbi:macro domain-containing protein CT2219-like [Lineus longissimus]|uniref:macro domain-containing protein CT2219-like n=1 Tax=Lineus longissimus TaxID=88925 RepID=UPI00315DF93F